MSRVSGMICIRGSPRPETYSKGSSGVKVENGWFADWIFVSSADPIIGQISSHLYTWPVCSSDRKRKWRCWFAEKPETTLWQVRWWSWNFLQPFPAILSDSLMPYQDCFSPMIINNPEFHFKVQFHLVFTSLHCYKMRITFPTSPYRAGMSVWWYLDIMWPSHISLWPQGQLGNFICMRP